MSLETATREITTSCLCRRARALARRITRVYDDALRDLGLTANQLTILAAVQRRGEVSQAGLGDLLEMEKSTVSRAIRRMIDNGWLAVAETGRGRSIVTTDAGRRCLTIAHERWKRAQEEIRAALGPVLVGALEGH